MAGKMLKTPNLKTLPYLMLHRIKLTERGGSWRDVHWARQGVNRDTVQEPLLFQRAEGNYGLIRTFGGMLRHPSPPQMNNEIFFPCTTRIRRSFAGIRIKNQKILVVVCFTEAP